MVIFTFIQISPLTQILGIKPLKSQRFFHEEIEGTISYYLGMDEKMGEQIERKAVELIEQLRKRMRPRVSQEKIGEYLWPRKYDHDGNEFGDPQKSYSLLITPRKGKEPRRLKLGEFIEACEFLNFDPIQLLTLAKLAAEKGLDVHAMLGEHKENVRASPPGRTRQETSDRARTTQGRKLGHDSR